MEGSEEESTCMGRPIVYSGRGGDHEQLIQSSSNEKRGTGDDDTNYAGAGSNHSNWSAEFASTISSTAAADVEMLQLLTSSRSRLLHCDQQDSLMSYYCRLPSSSQPQVLALHPPPYVSPTLPRGAQERMTHHTYHHTPGGAAAATMLPPRVSNQNQYWNTDSLLDQRLLSQYYRDFFLGEQGRSNDLDFALLQYENQYRRSNTVAITNNDDFLVNLSTAQHGDRHGTYPPSELAYRTLLPDRDILQHASLSSTAASFNANARNYFDHSSLLYNGNSRSYCDESGNCAASSSPSSSPKFSNYASSSTSSTSAKLPPSVASTNCTYPLELVSSTPLRHPTSLVVTSDSTFLDPVHIFLRRNCIELFCTTRESMMCQARGARASKVGQVGLRCIWCKSSNKLTTQAICFPSKRETIFDSVRNYQRKHIDACPCIPEQVKATYKSLLLANVPFNKSQRLLKAYYAEAASELGIVDSPKGLIFGAQPNTSGSPSENLLAIIRAAESPETSTEFWKSYKALSATDKSVSLRKFDHLVSEGSREVIMKARRDTSSVLVCSQDFPKVGDVEFLLYKQFMPCKPSLAFLKRRHIDPEEFGSQTGICCKFCAHANKAGDQNRGMYFPMSFAAFSDFSFTQSLLSHTMSCRNVPRELKDTFDELKHLASEHCVVAKRGSIKKFLEKIWERLQRCQVADPN
ncbi:hypothetical protein ACHAXH_006623 [Discostella pseudostelligera]